MHFIKSKISDAMSVNSTNWTSTDTKISDKNACLSLEIITADTGSKTLVLTIKTQIIFV